MRAAVTRFAGVLILAVLTSLTACDRGPAEPVASQHTPAGPTDGAVTTTDGLCLDPAVLRVEPVDREAIWARYLHWYVCDYDPGRAMRYLDMLVARNDPAAIHGKSVMLERTNPEESERLERRARALGWRERTRQDEMNELATPPS